MQGVLAGFATIAIVIALGWLLAHIRVLGPDSQLLLSKLAFFVASPALLVTVLAETDVHDVFSSNLAATGVGVVVAAVIYVLVARLVLHRDLADTVIGSLCSAYVNAGNLGLPIAAYVIGDVALVAPTLLLQLLVLQPLALALLDHAVAPVTPSVWMLLSRPVRNPLTVGSLVGVGFSVADVEIPAVIDDPLTLVGGMAVPGMLIAYGVSLRFGPLPGRGAAPTELGLVTSLKLVVQPLAAYFAGRFLFGLGDDALLAVTVLSALPTAQNIFVHATRYDRSVILARDAIFVSTMLAVPTMFVIVALLA